jgi:predicted enzyme related to lactoylglutathione lyase
MFEGATVYPCLAVKDLEKAKKFYGGNLGLKEMAGEDSGGQFYKIGNTKVFVYQSSYAGSNKATAMNCEVKDINKTVEAIKKAGAKFEHYDMPEVKREGDIHVFGELKAAWYKDPDGNIISLLQK